MNEDNYKNVESEEVVVEKRRSRAIYLLPNLFTTACLFCGFYAVVAAMKHHFNIAAMAIFIAMLADALDGRVARLTNTQSEFGAEYDSLADMVAFGIAPALVVYTWALYNLGKPGWLAAFFYAGATALRLARFNIQTEITDKRYFHGLPCPSAAGFIAGMIWVQHIYAFQGPVVSIIDGIFTVFMGLLMVSNINYRSFKDIDPKGKVSFFVILLMVLLFVCIALDPPEVLFGIFAIYAFSGPISALKNYLTRGKKNSKKAVEQNKDKSQ